MGWIREVNSFAEYVMLLKEGPFIALAPFCNQIACEKEIQALTQTSSRCSPLGKKRANLKCFKCQQEAHFKFYFARSY